MNYVYSEFCNLKLSLGDPQPPPPPKKTIPQRPSQIMK